MTFEEYWMDCTHSPNHYAEISTAFKAGAASRDAEIAELKAELETERCLSFRNQIAELESERDQLREQVKMLRDALKEIRDDFDCDEDAHRYGTTCRCCLAIKALAATEPTSTPTDI